jgi:hypothetical protein
MISEHFLKIVCFEIMWQNIVEPDRPQMTIRCMRIACCITFFLKIVCFEIMWQNIVETDRLQMKIRRMRIACCIHSF